MQLAQINMGKIALITGITGQDGSFLAEFLIENKSQIKEIAFIN